MTNYLNQIESDLYKLNSITNGSGEVVEMVAELKEKYEKAEAFDRIKAYSDKAINGDIHSFLLAEGIIDVVEQYDINRLSESGESDAKK